MPPKWMQPFLLATLSSTGRDVFNLPDEPPSPPSWICYAEGDDPEPEPGQDDPPSDDPEPDPAAPPIRPKVIGRSGAPIPPENVSQIRAEAAARARKKLLVDEYGTDNEAEVERIRAERKAKLEEHEKIKKDEEARKRNELTEIERLKADIAELNQKISTLERERDEANATLASERQGFKVRSIASQFIAPKPVLVESAVDAFRRHVVGLTKDEQKKLDERKIGAWFRDFVKDNPEFARPAPAPPKVEGDDPPIEPVRKPAASTQQRPRVPVGTRPGVPAKRPGVPPKPSTPRPGDNGSKTVRPNQPNSMSRQELNKSLKAQGIKPW